MTGLQKFSGKKNNKMAICFNSENKEITNLF